MFDEVVSQIEVFQFANRIQIADFANQVVREVQTDETIQTQQIIDLLDAVVAQDEFSQILFSFESGDVSQLVV